jgi:ketosteroid isomerase-like protein
MTRGEQVYRWTVGRFIRLVYRRAFAGQDDLMMKATAPDVTFRFPGSSSFATSLVGRESLREWLNRFTTFNPRFDVRDVVVSGPPWNMTVAVRFQDAIGSDYQNEGVEWLRIRWGKVRSLEVFLDTERVSAWEARHPEVAESPNVTGSPSPAR